MKRETYCISYLGLKAYTHAWNTAIRKTEKLMRALAKDKAKTYHLVNSTTEKDESGFYCVKGLRVWSSSDGEAITFSIEKLTA